MQFLTTCPTINFLCFSSSIKQWEFIGKLSRTFFLSSDIPNLKYCYVKEVTTK